MKSKYYFFATFLLINTVHAQEPFTLANNQIVYGYYSAALPPGLKKDDCDTYVFTDTHFSPLKNGKYTSQDGKEIWVSNSCLYPQTGKAILADGSQVEFYQANSFNLEGNIVLRDTKDGFISLQDENLILEKGQIFSVKKGHITDHGFFENGKIFYNDPN